MRIQMQCFPWFLGFKVEEDLIYMFPSLLELILEWIKMIMIISLSSENNKIFGYQSRIFNDPYIKITRENDSRG